MNREELRFATYDLFITWYKNQTDLSLPYSFWIEGESFLNIDCVWDHFAPLEGQCPDCGEVLGKGADHCHTCRDHSREVADDRRIDKSCAIST